MNKTCEVCGKSFESTSSRPDIKCCSFICSGLWRAKNLIGSKSPKWKGGKQEKKCEVCNKIFYVKQYRATTQKYCSIKCHSVSRIKHTSRTCQCCGREFTPPHDGRESQKYCSRICYVKSNVLEKHPRWLGGKSFEPYPVTFNKEFKKLVRERDNYTCAICKKYGKSVHHINYVKNDTVPENCITLCQSCHIKTNSNREYWIEYFEEFMLSYS